MILRSVFGSRKTSCVSGIWRRSLTHDYCHSHLRSACQRSKAHDASISLDGNDMVIAPPKSSRVEDIATLIYRDGGQVSSLPSPLRRSLTPKRVAVVASTALNHDRHLAQHALRGAALSVHSDIMADYRRRISTLQTSVDGYGRSGLPMPSTAKKPKHHSGRMSMSGPALRAPYPVPSGPGPTPRHSVMRSQNMNPLLMSTSKPSAYGRTPVHG